MITLFLIILTGCVGIGIGYLTRELKEAIKRIELTLKVLIQRQQKQEEQEIIEEAKRKTMSFGEPMTMAELQEMTDEERIQAFNVQM